MIPIPVAYAMMKDNTTSARCRSGPVSAQVCKGCRNIIELQPPPCMASCYGYINIYIYSDIRECGSTLYVGMAQGVSFSLYISIGAMFQNMQKASGRRLRRAEYRTVLL